MKIIVSSDRVRLINFEMTQAIDITGSEVYTIWADTTRISMHKQLESAKKQLQEIVSIMTADGPVVYQAEDTE